jgi:hypothetical protein
MDWIIFGAPQLDNARLMDPKNIDSHKMHPPPRRWDSRILPKVGRCERVQSGNSIPLPNHVYDLFMEVGEGSTELKHVGSKPITSAA